MAQTLDTLTVRFEAELGKLRADLQKVSQEFDRVGKKVDTSGRAMSGSLTLLKTAFAAVAFGTVARSTIQLADAMTNMRSRIRLVTDSTEEAVAVQQQLMDVAARTRTEFSAVGQLYARIGRSADELGLSQERLIAFTETFSQALKISGATTGEAQSTILQLSQALASGRLNGAELNAVLESGGRAAKALADGLGVPIGTLKKLGEEGELTSARVIAAIESQAGTINTEFKGMALTVGDATTVLQNALAETIGKMNEQTGATDTLSRKIVEFADVVKDPSFIAGLRGIADAVGFLANSMAGFVAMLGDAITLAQRFNNDIQALSGDGKFSFETETPEQKHSRAKRGVRNKGMFGDMLKSDAPAPKVKLGGAGSERAAKKAADEAAEATRRYEESVADLEFEIEQLGRSEAEAAFQAQLRNELAAAGVEADSARGQSIASLVAQMQALEQQNEALAKSEARNVELSAEWQSLYDQAGDSVASAFQSAIAEGEELSEVFKTLLADLARLIFQKMVFDQIASVVAGSLGGVVGGKAAGGSVHAGSAYIVGEGGPELFVPRTGGKIVPNAAGGGGVTLNSVVNAAPGTNRAELQAILNERDAALIKSIPRVMIDRQRRNALAGAF
jgi:tape measure domain-containing protein